MLAQRFNGYAAEEIVGRRLSAFYPEDEGVDQPIEIKPCGPLARA